MILKPFTKTYDGVKVLDFPGLELQPGAIYSVIGSNGSGKSTFARILAGVLDTDRKTVPFDSDISVGYMPQKNYAFRMSTRSNILLGGNDEAKALNLMNSLQIQHLHSKRADRLSGGEMARMALARLMMKKFDLVILDEPTAAMDMETTLLAEKLIVNYVEQTGCALVLVTHSLQQARRISSETVFFRKGQLVESGLSERILNDPKTTQLKQFVEFYGL